MLTSWNDDVIDLADPIDAGTCIESSRDAVIALDAGGRVAVWSGGAERMYGWRADDVIGRELPWRDGAHRGVEHAELHDLARRGVVVGAVPIETSRRNGSTVVAEVTVDPVRDVTGRIIGTCSVHRDASGHRVVAAEAPQPVVVDLAQAEQVEAGDDLGFDGFCERRELSEFDRDLIALLLTGHRVSTIARTLGRSPGTIRNRLSLLYRRFGVRGHDELLDLLHAEIGTAIEVPMTG
jgi:PAS domain S-box-containing protein